MLYSKQLTQNSTTPCSILNCPDGSMGSAIPADLPRSPWIPLDLPPPLAAPESPWGGPWQKRCTVAARSLATTAWEGWHGSKFKGPHVSKRWSKDGTGGKQRTAWDGIRAPEEGEQASDGVRMAREGSKGPPGIPTDLAGSTGNGSEGCLNDGVGTDAKRLEAEDANRRMPNAGCQTQERNDQRSTTLQVTHDTAGRTTRCTTRTRHTTTQRGKARRSWGVTSSRFRTACDLTPTSCEALDAWTFQALITLAAEVDRCCISARASTSKGKGQPPRIAKGQDQKHQGSPRIATPRQERQGLIGIRTQVAAFGGFLMLPRTLILKLWNSWSW